MNSLLLNIFGPKTACRKKDLHLTYWATDITYVPLTKGWCYLMAIVDLFSRKIVGFHLSADMKAASCLVAL